MATEYRINVIDDGGEVVGRVRSNCCLDSWNGRDFSNGGTGRHKGLTKLKDGRYVLINTTQHDGEKDYAEIITKENALQYILKSQNSELLELTKYKELKELHDSTMLEEDLEEVE